MAGRARYECAMRAADPSQVLSEQCGTLFVLAQVRSAGKNREQLRCAFLGDGVKEWVELVFTVFKVQGAKALSIGSVESLWAAGVAGAVADKCRESYLNWLYK